MRSHFELAPADYERQRSGHMHHRRVETIGEKLAGLSEGALVVEVGSGSGHTLADCARLRPDLRFVGIEVDEQMVGYARGAHALPRLEFRLGEAENGLPSDAALVFCIDVLHHVRAVEAFARSIATALRPGGRLLAIEPNRLNPYIWLHQERMRRAGLDEDHFRGRLWSEALTRAGLEPEHRTLLSVIPGAIRAVPAPLVRLERMLERMPLLAGSVVLGFRRVG